MLLAHAQLRCVRSTVLLFELVFSSAAAAGHAAIGSCWADSVMVFRKPMPTLEQS